MWIFLALVVILFLFNFNKAFNKDITQIKNDGGLENRYCYLINSLKKDYEMSVTNRTNNSVTLSARGKGVYVEFHIVKAFNDLNIIWTMKNLVDSHNIKWKFNSNDDQQYILNSIDLSIDNFNEKFYEKYKGTTPFF